MMIDQFALTTFVDDETLNKRKEIIFPVQQQRPQNSIIIIQEFLASVLQREFIASSGKKIK